MKKTAEEIFNDYVNIRTVGNEVAQNIIDAMVTYADQYKSKWIPIEEKLPNCKNKHHESKEVICFDPLCGQFVGWYNADDKIWRASIFTASNDEISNVTHWKQKDSDPE